jgi:ADP-ribosylglycohydrolase
MGYPKLPDFWRLTEDITLYSQLMHEYGARGIQPILDRVDKDIKYAIAKIRKLPIDKNLSQKEPDSLKAIQSLRPKGPRRIWNKIEKDYSEKLEGALLGRMAGCVLGAAVEFWPVDRMEALAKENGQPFPPTDYWEYVPAPEAKRYNLSPNKAYTKKGMNGVPVDDDIAYTLLGLLVLEEYGPDFTTADIGKAWLKYLPMACTAEHVALENLKKKISPYKAGETNNPFCEWIGADIRSDPWGYMAPGFPERAAQMAHRDAYISHRRQGIYGEMFFAASIAAAFTVDDPIDALKIGLTEIPRDCAMAKAVKWALKESNRIRNYKQAREAMEKKFKGMNQVHTINNACLTIWGLTIGGTDFTKVISETVAMGMDNDCTAATAGSIAGAIIGKKGIPKHWYARFNNTVHSYLIGKRRFSITGILRRFKKQAERVINRINK